MQTNDDGSIVLTRDELYKLVWTTPVVRLAKEFGLSDSGLAKACERLKVPRPGRGYWARRQHGRPARRVPLPKAEDVPPAITITPEPRNEVERPSKPDEPAVIEVPEALTDPHRLVARTADSLRAAKPGKEGLVAPRAKQTLDVRVAPERVDRAMRICDALIKAFQERGWSVRVEEPKRRERQPHDSYYGYDSPPKPEMTPRRTFAMIDGEAIGFAVYERVTRARRDLTPAEIKRQESDPWWSPSSEWTYTPTGHLYLEISTTTRDHRGPHKWFDRGKHRTLDRRLA
jgi:hypothetical protein